MTQQEDQIREIVQAILAFVVVIGGGVLLFTNNPNAGIAMPFVTLILGWYFGMTNAKATTNGNGSKNGGG